LSGRSAASITWAHRTALAETLRTTLEEHIMKRARIGAAALLIGAILAAPAAAMADPWVSAVSNGTEMGEGGNTGVLGDVITISGTGCVNPEPGQPAYMGEFVAQSDPLNNPEAFKIEFETDASGAFEWETPMVAEAMTYYARWYCSTTPIDSLDQADLWVSPLSWMTFEEPTTPVAARQAMTSKVQLASFRTAAVTPNTGPSVELVTDPDGLPAMDQMGIVGPKAAQLKSTVDWTANTSNKLANFFARLSGKRVKDDGVSNADYVKTSFVLLTGKSPSAKAMAPYVARLDNGGLKVQVVEDIALTAHNAAWWNRRG
jgi:hypothetical protein